MSDSLQELSFLKDGGQMGQLVRSKDWSVTALGSPRQWPQSLRTSVSLLLNSQFPMFVWWGPEYITLYNDAYRVILGEKHPASLGHSGPEVWAEIWDVVGPLADSVFRQGQATWAEDQLLYINRHGYTEESYFTFSYSPIYSDDGTVGGVFCACAETTEKVLATRKIRESEQNFRHLIMQAPVGICLLRGDTFIVETVNNAFLELVGQQREHFEKRPYWDTLKEAEPYYGPILSGVKKTGVSHIGKEAPVTLQRNGQKELVYVSFVYEPIRESDGSIERVMLLGLDVTDQVMARKRIEESEHELQQRVRERTVELEKKNAELEEYAYVSSHDLQEPLRKIAVFREMIQQRDGDKLSPESASRLEKIGDAVSRMSRSLKDLLNYASLSAPDSITAVSLDGILEEVINDLELVIEGKGATVQRETLPVIQAVPRQMYQVFYNLLNNALKFSRPGVPPLIIVRGRRLAPAEVQEAQLEAALDYLQVEVKDNGIGFKPEMSDKIFTLFQRLHNKSDYEGTGIGLSLVKKVIGNHNGRISVSSQVGEGSVFTIVLPV